MPSFRDQVITALLEPLEPTQRERVEGFVAGSLGDLPHHLRFGIALDSVLLEAITRTTNKGRVPDPSELRALVARWETNPLTPIRQYARLLSSLVLFGDHETRPDTSTR